MAIARVTSPSQNVITGSANSSTTLVLTLPNTPIAGNIIALGFGATGATLQSIVATNIQFYLSLCNGTNNTTAVLAIGRVFSSPGAAITITWSTAGQSAGIAQEYSAAGLLRLDKTITNAPAASTSAASGATATTGTAAELWLGVICARGTNANALTAPTNSFAFVAGGTGYVNSTIGTTNNDRTVTLIDQIVSSTGTANAGCTLNTSNNWSAIAMTLEETPAAGGATGGAFTFGG